MTSLKFAGASLIVLAVVCVGCGPTDFTVTKKASYADLVVTYNAEVETLDKLEAKRAKVIADYYSQAQEKALKAAVNSLDKNGALTNPSNPNQALDQAVASAELQARLQSGILEKIGQSPTASTDPAEGAEFPEELKRKLVDLDAEIVQQKARVERARSARDAAQPK